MSSYNFDPDAVNSFAPEIFSGPLKEVPRVKASILNTKCQIIATNGFCEFRHPTAHIIENPNLMIAGYPGKGTKEAITKFTSRSRKNLLSNIMSIAEQPRIFITLTYPGTYPKDSAQWKRHLDNFRRVFFDEFPDAWFYWKLEPQKRGAPHYHLVGDLRKDFDLKELRRFVAQNWYRVCATKDPKHLKAGTGVEIIKNSHNKLRYYVCKYLAKVDTEYYPEWARPGRFWGKWGKVPVSTALAVTLQKKEYFQIRRVVRKWLRKQSKGCKRYSKRLRKLPSFYLLIPIAFVDKLLELVLGKVPF